MIITDLHKLSFTEPADYPEFIAIIKKFGWSMTGLVTLEDGTKYFRLHGLRGRSGLQRYNNKNKKKKKPEFSLELVEYSFMMAFLYKRAKNVNTDMHYNFKELFTTNLPYDLFKELFSIDKADTITDKHGTKEWTVRYHKKDGDNYINYYLLVNNKFLYAAKVTSNDIKDTKEEIPISDEWTKQFKKYQYLCVGNMKKSMCGANRVKNGK